MMSDKKLSTDQERRSFRILLAVSNPESSLQLAKLAAAMATHREGEVVVLHVDTQREKEDRTQAWWPIVDGAVETIREAGITANYLIRHGKPVGKIIRKVAIETQADLILLGWRGLVLSEGDFVGAVLDAVLESPPCDVLVLGGGLGKTLNRFLVPISGGPNAGKALEVAVGLAESIGGRVTALYVCQQQGCSQDIIKEAEDRLRWQLGEYADHPCIETLVIPSPSAIQGIIDEAAKNYDLVWMGASQEAVFDSDLFGGIPRRVAVECRTPVAVVKRKATAAGRFLRWAWWRVFEILPTLNVDERREVQKTIYRGARSRIDFFLMTALSSAIATFGLLLDSPAVIIGAMLVAPLMASIVGIGLGVVLGGAEMLRQSLLTTLRGILLAIAVSAIIGLFHPNTAPTTEILNRIQPGVMDLGVALASGLAGAYAACRKDVSSSLAGVAIAVALVPPLAVVGLGISMGRWDIALGALLLFATNLIAIASAGGLIFLLVGFAPPLGRPERWAILRRGFRGELVLLLTIAVILTLVTIQTTTEARERELIYAAVLTQVAHIPDTETDRADIVIVENSDNGLELSITVRSKQQIPYETVLELQKGIATRLQRKVALKLVVIPTTELDPLIPPTLTPTPTFTPTPTLSPSPTAGPSATSTTTSTPTPTFTFTPSPTFTPTATETASSTPTPSSTPSKTPTPTYTATPTPIAASVFGTGYAGLVLRDVPDGAVIDGLYEGEKVMLYHDRQVVNGLEWALVSKESGEQGWVVTRYLKVP